MSGTVDIIPDKNHSAYMRIDFGIFPDQFRILSVTIQLDFCSCLTVATGGKQVTILVYRCVDIIPAASLIGIYRTKIEFPEYFAISSIYSDYPCRCMGYYYFPSVSFAKQGIYIL